MIVDDAHWADAPSLRFLAFLLPRLEGLGAALVVAARPRESPADAGLLATLATDPNAELLRIAPLTRTAVGQFLAERLSAMPDPAFVEACLRATRGTPFLMRELVAALREEAIGPTAAAAEHVEEIGARTVGRSILLRLDRLPESAARLARAVAILETGELWQAARLAELDIDEAADGGRPSSPPPRSSPGPAALLRPSDRARGHLRGAVHGPTARAGTARRPTCSPRTTAPTNAWPSTCWPAMPAGGRWVVERLVEAARAAAHSGAPESAAVYLRRALEEPPPPSERPGCCSSWGWPRRAPACPRGRHSCRLRWRPRPTTAPEWPRRWCSRWPSGARSAPPRRSRCSTAPPCCLTRRSASWRPGSRRRRWVSG